MNHARKHPLTDFEQSVVYEEEHANTIILVVVIVAIGLVVWGGLSWWVWRLWL